MKIVTEYFCERETLSKKDNLPLGSLRHRTFSYIEDISYLSVDFQVFLSFVKSELIKLIVFNTLSVFSADFSLKNSTVWKNDALSIKSINDQELLADVMRECPHKSI